MAHIKRRKYKSKIDYQVTSPRTGAYTAITNAAVLETVFKQGINIEESL